MISITAAQAGTIIVNIIPIGRVGAMLLATAEAVMAQLELSWWCRRCPARERFGGGTAGTIVGGVAGALVGRTLDKKNTRDHNAMRNGC
jgi:hypothetical protein